MRLYIKCKIPPIYQFVHRLLSLPKLYCTLNIQSICFSFRRSRDQVLKMEDPNPQAIEINVVKHQYFKYLTNIRLLK